MPPQWPGTLPQRPLVEGFTEQPPDVVLVTNMEVGPPKTRRRSTAGIRKLPQSMKMTKAQLETFDTFFNATLQGGALTFDWVHPRTLAAITCKLFGPKYVPLVDGVWRVTFELWVMP